MHPSEPCVRLSGDLDTNSVDTALEILNTAIAAATGTSVTVDLSGVTFADSSALGMLLDAKERADADGVVLVLLNVPAQMQRVLELTRLDSLFDVRQSPDSDVQDASPESA